MSNAPEPTGSEARTAAGTHTNVVVPQDAVVMGVVEVANYIDSDGKSRYGLRVAGGETYVHAYGMLQFGIMTLHEMQLGRDE